MTSEELYKKLDAMGIEYEVVEVFEGLRVVEFLIEETEEEKV